MRAIAVNEFGGRDNLRLVNLPVPEIGENDILIEIMAAGVNPVDWKIREGMLRHRIPHEFPLVPGWDAAGVVVKAGPNARLFSEGQEVYAFCRKPVVRDGTYAEYVSVPQDCAALAPRNMSFEEAATVPLAALAAYQSLFDSAMLAPGETVLIHAAAGGVGTFAVQLARDKGANIIGTAGARNHEYLRSLGASAAVDYNSRDFRDAVREFHPGGVDVVFDCVGGDTLARSADVLHKDSRIVSIADPYGVRELKKNGRRCEFVFVEPNHEQLSELTRMIEAGRLGTHIAAAFPLEDAAKAHELSESRHVRGKIVLTVQERPGGMQCNGDTRTRVRTRAKQGSKKP